MTKFLHGIRKSQWHLRRSWEGRSGNSKWHTVYSYVMKKLNEQKLIICTMFMVEFIKTKKERNCLCEMTVIFNFIKTNALAYTFSVLESLSSII